MTGPAIILKDRGGLCQEDKGCHREGCRWPADRMDRHLMSRRQSIIPQSEEYGFMQELMKGENGQLPRLLVDAVNCREMVSSVEKAPAGIRYKGENQGGVQDQEE